MTPLAVADTLDPPTAHRLSTGDRVLLCRKGERTTLDWTAVIAALDTVTDHPGALRLRNRHRYPRFGCIEPGVAAQAAAVLGASIDRIEFTLRAEHGVRATADLRRFLRRAVTWLAEAVVSGDDIPVDEDPDPVYLVTHRALTTT